MASVPVNGCAQGFVDRQNAAYNVEIQRDTVSQTPFEGNIEKDLATVQNNFHDSGYFENELFEANTHETNDYDNQTYLCNLELDGDFILADFFKDVTGSSDSACCKNDSTNTTYIPTDLFHGYRDISNPRISTAYQAILDFESQTKLQSSDLSDEFTTYNPLEQWTRKYEQHESIAYRLEEPLHDHGRNPYPTKAPVRFSSKRLGDETSVELAKRRTIQQ
jgi:hypothetical protein